MENVYNLINTKYVNLNFFFEMFFKPLKIINKLSYKISEIIKDYPTSSKVNLKILDNINFKNRIQKILWCSSTTPFIGMGDYICDVIGIIKINADFYYFYLNCRSCYTGFSASGSMNLYLNKSLENLIKYALSNDIRNLILRSQGNFLFRTMIQKGNYIGYVYLSVLETLSKMGEKDLKKLYDQEKIENLIKNNILRNYYF